MRKISPLMLVTAILAASIGTAFAHAYLRSAVPAVDSTVIQAPTEVSIAFTGAIEPSFSTIVVTNSNSRRMDDAHPRSTPGDTTHLSVGVGNLPPGTYTVVWHATSVDTHQTDGSYRFTVAVADPSGISFEHVWARATVGLGTTGAAYFTVTCTMAADQLVGASTPVAAKAELHETINDNGVMKMRPVGMIALAPGQPVMFRRSRLSRHAERAEKRAVSPGQFR